MDIIETRNDLITLFNQNMIICEIGVFKGEFSKIILDTLNPSELHLIDIFEGSMCSGDKDGNNIVWTNLNDEYQKILNKYQNNDIVKIHKGKSVEILEKFDDDFFDMIYIDGDHTYNGIKSDLNISYFKIKNGGLICGHDYNPQRFPEVVKAVDEFCKEKNLKINYVTKDGCPTFCIKTSKILIK